MSLILWLGLFAYYVFGMSGWITILALDNSIVAWGAIAGGAVIPALFALANRKTNPCFGRLALLGGGAGFLLGMMGVTPVWLNLDRAWVAFGFWLALTLGGMIWTAPMMLDEPNKESVS